MSVSRILAAFFVSGAASVAFGQALTFPSPLPVFDAESDGGIFLPESIIGPSSLVDITTLRDSNFYDMARVVARVEKLDGDGFCTGSRIGENLFITNFHCWEYGQMDVQFHLGYETGAAEDNQAIYKATAVIEKFEQLDFAIYRVERTDTNTVEFPIATLSKQALVMNMPLIVPGHPAARTKEIDLSDSCRMTRIVPYDFYNRLNVQHQCDTEGGNSGSPVMDRDSGHIAALHWGATGGTDSNHAIPMNLILERMQTMYPDVYAELTVFE